MTANHRLATRLTCRKMLTSVLYSIDNLLLSRRRKDTENRSAFDFFSWSRAYPSPQIHLPVVPIPRPQTSLLDAPCVPPESQPHLRHALWQLLGVSLWLERRNCVGRLPWVSRCCFLPGRFPRSWIHYSVGQKVQLLLSLVTERQLFLACYLANRDHHRSHDAA